MSLLTLPFGIIFAAAKYIWEKVEKPVLMPILKRSHGSYLDRMSAGRFWSKIGDDFEFSICLRSSLSIENSPSEIIIRNISDEKFYKANLCVFAENEEHSYQQDITLYNVTDKYIHRQLVEIPQNDLWFNESKQITTKFDYVSVLLDSVVLENGETITLNQRSIRYQILKNDWLNSKWIPKWGRLWNADEIEEQKRCFRENYLYNLCYGENLILVYGGMNSGAYRGDSIFDKYNTKIGKLEWLTRSFLYSTLSSKSVSSLVFWSLLILRLKSLDGEHQFRLESPLD